MGESRNIGVRSLKLSKTGEKGHDRYSLKQHESAALIENPNSSIMKARMNEGVL